MSGALAQFFAGLLRHQFKGGLLVRMWMRLRLTTKIPLAIIGFSMLVGVGVGLASYWTSAAQVSALASEKLSTIASDRRAQLVSYLSTIEQDLKITAANPETRQAVKSFSSAFEQLGQPATELLQARYIHENPYPLGEKLKLDAAPSGTRYDATHKQMHPWFRQLLQERGYYDVFLFDPKGNLVYTVFKELDFATNFKSGAGPWAETGLGAVFRDAVSGPPGSVHFRDFARYGPSHNAAASFISTPIFDGERLIGVLAFQMPIDRINLVMNGGSGLGATGETILLGEDGLMRNNSRFTPEDDVLATRLEVRAGDEALHNHDLFENAIMINGVETFQSAAHLEFHGVHWDVVVVQSQYEVLEPVRAMRNAMLLAAFGLFALAGAGAYGLARSLTVPLRQISDRISDLAQGRLDVDAGSQSLIDRIDEVGDMSRALHVFADNAEARAQLEHEARRDRERDRQRQVNIEALIEQFRSIIARILASVEAEGSAMSASANQLTSVAGEANWQAESARGAFADSSISVQSVAVASGQLTASIREIAMQAHRTSSVVQRATALAQRADEGVSELATAADQIGAVVGMIRQIASQTNLLALNAAIEAARSGESGRGFAVVASEVKALASQTARATEEIGLQIAKVQGSSRNAVESIRTISSTMSEVDMFTSAIAVAVEEQDAATRDISESIARASQGSHNLSRSVEATAAAMGQTSAVAGNVSEVSARLTGVASELSRAVEDFLERVNANAPTSGQAQRALSDAG
jgi:methyl-accepting chemotaxis protein